MGGKELIMNELEQVSVHYYLPLRGHSINKMIDAATPLLGMLLRLKDLNSETMPDKLYTQVVTDIQSIEQLLKEQGYESGVIVSFRYIFCTFIDEVALSQGWGSNNNWLNKSLLTHFHNETWGGEKVYILLEKLMSEPKRYKDLLEFMFLCFSLGFRGRYKVNNHNGEFEVVYRRLYDLLNTLKDSQNETLVFHQYQKKIREPYYLPKKLTVKKILVLGFIGLSVIYSIYFFRLDYQSKIILEQLNNLLK
ncbi:hypothetical protein BKG92_07415 [Rodentibacter ratti]|uniref:Type IV / VI secretion system DotU domain-containing protein n=2 Tax=Rodentibacter ratti TaxID=1906745 RepID=A0A1V3KXT4_9PAST|nr:hypothetical protein BKG92_07415 [Rodentibacter ratti]